MRSKIFQSMIILILITLSLVSDARTQFYQNSYALVIGINEYPSPNWSRLNYARKDAQGVAAFLTSRGFEVTQLYDTQATRTRIISEMHKIAKKVEENDRILVFFAGHGHTERFGEQDAGYIVPYDGTYDSATFISMEEIRSQSTRMGTAKHQLFIMDACYGGLLGTRAGALDPSIPHYLQAITQRDARQIITAGGKNQQVLDRGPGGHSVFTGHILKAIKDGMADINGDGYITFAELSSYVVPAASNSYQTPAPGT
ncbi:polysaccharide deacetylase, partial [candidate division KSB1 bacterium]|nr:polysaccharide deacetylase [candidate division KSB1 bacterium]NIV69928.1 polysaccharide deacetylase [Phycisphaerae bacterium]NIT70118.1 polysaccharide deacetylase [candidate division KSB1 bacterium]NIU23775.1 polysaccharide deacetylase [candidate division KSB1 bacterium]NIU91960.1 polysaccharide deacetylase [candidate division KSB1 bacterium]